MTDSGGFHDPGRGRDFTGLGLVTWCNRGPDQQAANDKEDRGDQEFADFLALLACFFSEAETNNRIEDFESGNVDGLQETILDLVRAFFGHGRMMMGK